jgi:hypothetical protein
VSERSQSGEGQPERLDLSPFERLLAPGTLRQTATHPKNE